MESGVLNGYIYKLMFGHSQLPASPRCFEYRRNLPEMPTIVIIGIKGGNGDTKIATGLTQLIEAPSVQKWDNIINDNITRNKKPICLGILVSRKFVIEIMEELLLHSTIWISCKFRSVFSCSSSKDMPMGILSS